MKKLILILLTLGFAYSINGTITFYDGTTLEGELSSSDVRYVFIIPEGLVMAEKIPIVDIESLSLENGISLIEGGIAQQTYIDGKFSKIERDATEEISITDNEEEYEDYSLGNLDYFSIGAFAASPVYYRPSLLLENDKTPTALQNIGLSFSLPYFPIGPVNMSAGGRIITIGFDKNYGTEEEPIKIKSITLAGLLFTDLQPILNFMGENIHLGMETGITYSLGWEENYDGGIGIVVGGILDYWFEDSPLGIRLFGNGYMIPSPGDSMTGFGNIGASLLLSLKRGE
tara:strand:- start:330 stop:1187 length:858 start_codon:yes stop_codon:yes gene_type:complete